LTLEFHRCLRLKFDVLFIRVIVLLQGSALRPAKEP